VAVTYRLVREPVPASPPLVLDADQQRVADHGGGPLLVLAGPGTGKTATLVESVARQVEAGADPEALLLLTFSRRAAAELRERLALRLGAGHVPPTAWTFHAFCVQVLARYGDGAPLLVGGPEQDLAVRELLRGDLADGRPWPAPLDGVLDSRGLAAEVRALISRAQSVGLGPDGLARTGRTDWQAVADFYARYLDVLDLQNLVDYGELVTRAAHVAGLEQMAMRTTYDAVWVDEYQDTDPAQELLLRAIAGDGRDLVVVGDPDQSIYAFRGADVRGILEFPTRFPRSTGEPAPVVALRTCRRSGAALVGVSRRIAEGLPTPGLEAADRRQHRGLRSDHDGGETSVLLYPSPGAEADGIADLLRRAHLDDGVPWSDMAVLVRSGQRQIPLLRRVLGASGVPVEVAGDEIPLADEPAVAPLLLALRCAADPAELTEARAAELLVSPLVAADAGDLRRAGRRLRQEFRDAHPGQLPPASARAIRDGVLDPASEIRPLRRLGDLLRSAAAALADGTAEDALWIIWSSSDWPRRLVGRAGGQGSDGRAADRDLDAVLALFTEIARSLERRPQIGITGLLDALAAQAIPAGTQDERALARPGVRLLTAHRSKGLEWRLVVVAGVQDGGWPDLRVRGSLLQPDSLGPGGEVLPPSPQALLADERRLFYVACTRARERLVVTAVDAASDDGSRPSRFLAALGVEPVSVTRRPTRPRTLAGLVAALRQQSVDGPPEVRRAAAARLAKLAAVVDDDGRALVPQAHPARWWGLAEQTDGPVPYDPGLPLPLSTSSMEKLAECPLQWYLAHEVHADTATSPAIAFGKVIHALADLVAQGLLSPDELPGQLDRVWSALGYEAPWQASNERAQATEALRRLAVLLDRDGRTLVGTEIAFDQVVETPGGPVRVRGRLDRVEVAADDTVVVVDLKTSKTPPSAASLTDNPQLRLYQYAVDAGFLDGVGGASGGAELWQLRNDASDGAPMVQVQGPTHDHEPILVQLGAARQQIVAERFPPLPEEQRCERCAYELCCPARPRGLQVIT
jgi:superfamily I DNA/RNA helicase/RecB family exonuclease